ncbi:MAG: hypothetical protein CVV49_07360 [Spirochaetae bacterium HGW-Spirochaetae-5]|nr:MAG: hypothetical protein CVV49_07360 [Spirochaetae bacterium HGW-Spirochaetae-5]
MNEMKSIQLYKSLTEKLDAHEVKVLNKYNVHIRCRKGCADCCILESVFPVDAYVIYNAVLSGDILRENLGFDETPGRCVFLDKGLCSIYNVRPVICRTHGYPVFVEGRTDFCPENFKDLKSLDSEFILDLENLNKALASINIIFQREIEEGEIFLKERITLRELKGYILENA